MSVDCCLRAFEQSLHFDDTFVYILDRISSLGASGFAVCDTADSRCMRLDSRDCKSEY